ncbi:Crp/Fnr family transcriptional regulator [Polaribacter porphyrae]|uniref:Cyclic nucleotide-binding domain-containing protein n=1 Tax=Polaribacter porphyrae TaxID=1137780 RepID=A0A2S7WN61_9FLAO|nr:Crp/Fnr family transcriptional regulator [Polaribacter porphyrae]PQJ79040.1 hypothetical protein BTO18_07585 [Polaribacter porphyrae]
MNLFENFFLHFSDLPKKSYKSFLNLAKKENFKKNDFITKVGQKPKSFFIIKSGIVRSFYEDKNAKEYTRTIFTSPKSTGSLSSLITGKPSELHYQCLTDSVLYRINFNDFKKLTTEDSYILKLYSEVLEFIFLMMENRIYELSVLNASERYLKLKKEIPDIESYIAQYHIASYLNISPVQLSRIRKEMLKNQSINICK